jgi:hypothetical protein
MMRRPRRWIATPLAMAALLVTAAMATPAAAEESGGGDLRDIRLGTPAADLSKAGYANLACAGGSQTRLASWIDWRDCPADAAGFHAITFAYDPATSPDGTIVAGHPAVLTLLVDGAGTASGLRIETDPKARAYLRKKAFLFGIQVKSRYGQDGWSCTQAQPSAGEQPVGGVYVSERCTKTTDSRQIIVERHLFRRPDQDMKTFVDETRLTILRTKD